MDCSLIMGVRLENRSKSAVDVQEILTEYGCCIRTRLGLHDQEESCVCSPAGLMLLQLCCGEEKARDLETALLGVEGVRAKLINLS